MPSVTLPYPPSANRYWRVNRTGKPYRSAEAAAYIEAVGWECAARGLTDPLLETVSVRLAYHHAPGRRIDLDNGLKQILDALQGYAYSDDKQIVHLEAELVQLPRSRTPYVVVVIVPCEARVLEAADGYNA